MDQKYNQALLREIAARGTCSTANLKKHLKKLYDEDRHADDSDMEDERQEEKLQIKLQKVLREIRSQIEPLGLTLKSIQTKKRKRGNDETTTLWALKATDMKDTINMKHGTPFSEEENVFLSRIMDTLKDEPEGVPKVSLLACRQDIPDEIRKKLSDVKSSFLLEKFVDQDILKRTGRSKKYSLGEMGQVIMLNNSEKRVKVKAKKTKKHEKKNDDFGSESETETET